MVGSVRDVESRNSNRIGLKCGAGRRESTRESSVKRQLFATAVLALAFVGGGPAPAAAQASTALTGRVSSAEEGAMEGVVVSAKKAGSTVTVSVVSDDRGRFAFPSAKLGSGSYSLKVRATGYELDGPGSVEVTLAPMRDFGPDSDKQAAYLATLNQSSGAWTYELKTLPRVKGKGTRVVITEYDLPRRPLMPHDVIVDRDGIVWYSQFDQQFLGRFDPKTLTHAEFAIPVQRLDFPNGTRDLEVDPAGYLCLSHMFQSGI